jgi:hypothetical protein
MAYASFWAVSPGHTPDSRLASWGMRYAALKERKVKKLLFHYYLKFDVTFYGGNGHLHGAV